MFLRVLLEFLTFWNKILSVDQSSLGMLWKSYAYLYGISCTQL